MEGLRSKNHQVSTSQAIHIHHLKVLNVHYDRHDIHLHVEENLRRSKSGKVDWNWSSQIQS